MPEDFDEAQEDVDAAWAIETRNRVAAVLASELESEDWRLVLDRVEKEILGR
jgi:hypothetical protein